MANVPGEDEFDRYLRGDSNLSRLYREQPQEAPPARMADAIRGAARHAAQQRVAPRPPSWFDRLFRKFRLPLTALASGVLVVTLSLQVLHEKGDGLISEPGPVPGVVEVPEPSAPPVVPAPTVASAPTVPHVAPAAARPPSPAPARPAPPPVPPLEEKSLPFDLGNLPPPTAEQWLEDIRALLRQGKTQEAREELRHFRKAHPGQVLPDDLKPLESP